MSPCLNDLHKELQLPDVLFDFVLTNKCTVLFCNHLLLVSFAFYLLWFNLLLFRFLFFVHCSFFCMSLSLLYFAISATLMSIVNWYRSLIFYVYYIYISFFPSFLFVPFSLSIFSGFCLLFFALFSFTFYLLLFFYYPSSLLFVDFSFFPLFISHYVLFSALSHLVLLSHPICFSLPSLLHCFSCAL